jgi:hypothetical protein
MVDLTKCQIKIANLINCKSQWPLSMVNLTSLGHLDGPLAFLTRCLVCHMVKNVILIKCVNKK